MSIQWFPGHMTSARRKAAETMEFTDVVIEVLDARLPEASCNPMITELRLHRQRPCLKINGGNIYAAGSDVCSLVGRRPDRQIVRLPGDPHRSRVSERYRGSRDPAHRQAVEQPGRWSPALAAIKIRSSDVPWRFGLFD